MYVYEKLDIHPYLFYIPNDPLIYYVVSRKTMLRPLIGYYYYFKSDKAYEMKTKYILTILCSL